MGSTSGAAPRKSSSGGSGAAHPGVARPRSAQSQEHPPVKKIRRSSPAPSASSTPTQEVSRSKAIAQAPIPMTPIEVEPEEVKEVVNIKDDPEVLGLASTSAVNPDLEAGQEFGGEDYDESYDGYYEDDGAEMGDGAEGTDGTKDLQMMMELGEFSSNSPKKSRIRYSYQDKANLIQSYQEMMEVDPENCSMKKFAIEANISKSMLFRWIKNKDEIFRKCAIEQGLP